MTSTTAMELSSSESESSLVFIEDDFHQCDHVCYEDEDEEEILLGKQQQQPLHHHHHSMKKKRVSFAGPDAMVKVKTVPNFRSEWSLYRHRRSIWYTDGELKRFLREYREFLRDYKEDILLGTNRVGVMINGLQQQVKLTGGEGGMNIA